MLSTKNGPHYLASLYLEGINLCSDTSVQIMPLKCTACLCIQSRWLITTASGVTSTLPKLLSTKNGPHYLASLYLEGINLCSDTSVQIMPLKCTACLCIQSRWLITTASGVTSTLPKLLSTKNGPHYLCQPLLVSN